MARDVRDPILRSILPDSILGDSKIQRVCDSLDPLLSYVTGECELPLILSRIDELPETAVDLLAWHFHVDFYEPLGLSLEAKRRLVKGSIVWHRRKGTPWAVEKLLEDLGIKGRFKEWWKYDGTPYTCRVRVPIMDMKDSSLVRRAIDCAKSARTHLDCIELFLSQKEQIDPSSLQVMRNLALMEESYPWVGFTYDGSWTYGDDAIYDNSLVPDLVGDRAFVSLDEAFFSDIRYDDEGLIYDGSAAYDLDIESVDMGVTLFTGAVMEEIERSSDSRTFYPASLIDEEVLTDEANPMVSENDILETVSHHDKVFYISMGANRDDIQGDDSFSPSGLFASEESIDHSEDTTSCARYDCCDRARTDELIDLQCTREVLYDGTVCYDGAYGGRSVKYETEKLHM